MSEVASALMDLIQSQRITAVIYVAVKLGITDVFGDDVRTSEQIAERVAADPRSIRRLLRALVTIGICEAIDDDDYRLTAMGELLAKEVDPPLRSWALFEGEMLTRAWGGLLDSVRTGKNGAELAGASDSFELMGRDPERVAIFNDAMVALTRLITPSVLEMFDFSQVETLMDVGGGYGQLLAPILAKYPHTRGIVFDLERCAEGCTAQLASAGVGDRARFVAGNFFEAVPGGADTHILKSIIHDWADDRATAILRNCRQALPPNGRLLLVERVMPDTPRADAEDRSIALSDLNMLRGPGGCERTAEEYRALLAAAGFAIARIVPAGRVSVIEAKLAG